MRLALLSVVILSGCSVVFAADDMPSVINHGITAAPVAAEQPAETQVDRGPAISVACANTCTRTEVRSTSRCRNRAGLVRRSLRGTVEVSRTVVRTVTRPLTRVCGSNCCN